MAVYRIREDSLYLTEIPIYGSSRLGVIKENKLLKVKTAQNNNGVMSLPIPVNIAQSKNTPKPSVYTMGKKHYESTDWLGNVRVTYTDKKSWSNGRFALNVSSSQDYYPFGSVMEGRGYNLAAYRFGFNGFVKDNEVYGIGNLYDMGARLYDSRIGRTQSIDPSFKEYSYLSLYNYVNNNPIIFIDPDGKRFYFSAGAAHDPDKTGYIQKMLKAFEMAGIANTVDVPAHGTKISDILFTIGPNSRIPADRIKVYEKIINIPNLDEFGVKDPNIQYELKNVPTDWRIKQTVKTIKEDLQKNPLAEGEQLNLSGYSTGSVIMAQSALKLAQEGYVIDNLILIGSPIAEDSELFKQLSTNANIKNIIRIDIEGDDVRDLNKGGSIWSALWNFLKKGEDHPHFKYAFGENAEKERKKLAEDLKKQGVK